MPEPALSESLGKASEFAIAAVPLWMAPLILFAAALGLVLLGARIERPARVAAFALLGALAVLAPDGGAAWSGRTVLTPIARLARVGSLDLALGMALDRTSLVVGAALLAAWVTAFATGRQHASALSTARSLVAAGFATAGVLADGFPLLFLAFAATAVATPIAVGAPGAPGRFYALAAAAGVAMALGAAFLFWSLGGRWLDDNRYLSDYRARFVVRDAEKHVPGASRGSSPNAQGSLTIVSHPGAKIYDGVADEAQLARSQPIAISPAIRVPVVAGLHKIAIAPGEAAVIAGDGLEVALVDVVQVREGNDTVIILQGPSVTFHEIAPQLADTATFLRRRLLAFPAAAFVSGSFLAALLLLAGALRAPLAGPLGPLAGAGALAVASVALARIGPLVTATPPIGLAFAVVAAVVAVFWALRARSFAAESALGPLALLATAAASVAPAAPAAAAAAIALGAFAAAQRAEPRAEPRAGTTTPPKKAKKKRAAQPVDASSDTAQTSGTAPALRSPLGLARAALSGAPVPGGAVVLGALGVAGAFAGMGLGNALSAVCVVVTWACVVFVVWRAPSGAAPDAPRSATVAAAAALLLGPLVAVALRPWDVPATVSIDARGGLAVLGFAIAAVVAVRTRSLAAHRAVETTEPPADGGSRLARLGLLIDRIATAPLDLVALPFAHTAPRGGDDDGRAP